MMWWLFVIALFVATPANAQSVTQTGQVTPGHAAAWRANGVIGDAGGALGSPNLGRGYITELGITGTGTPFCINDALTSGAYHQMCFSPHATIAGNTGAFITVNPYAGAPSEPFYFNKDGVNYEFPFTIGGIVGPVSSVVGDCAIWANTSGSLLKDEPCPIGMPAVANNTALKAIATPPSATIVFRAGFAAAGDGGAAVYTWGAAACVAGGAGGDNGYQVQPSSLSGCWTASIGATTDLRVWGIPTGVDDTALLQHVDTAIGLGLNTTLSCVGTFAAKNWHFTHISAVRGESNACVFALATPATISDLLAQYDGIGPLTIESVIFSCPIYDPVTRAQPAGVYALRVGALSGSTLQSSFVKLRHIRTIGCQNGIYLFGSQYVDIDDLFNDRPWDLGWVVSSQDDSTTTHTREIHIHHTYGVSAGQYCGSIPVNGNNTTLAPRVIDISDVSCDGAGFKDQKFCFDYTGSSYDYGVFSGWGRNCYAGGLEVKRTTENGSETPVGIHDTRIDFNYYSTFDNGVGIALANPATSVVNDLRFSDFDIRGMVVWSPAPLRVASTSYESGATFIANGNVYKVVTPGTTAAGGGPSGVTNGITDGTTQVDYLQVAPVAAAGNLIGMEIDSVLRARIDLTVYNAAWGVQLFPRGGLTASLQAVDLHLVGVNITNACMYDLDNGVGSPTISVRLTGECSSSGGNSRPMFDLGNVANSSTSLEIIGGSWRQAQPCPTGFTPCDPEGLVRNSGASGSNFDLKISGAPHFSAFNRILYLEGPSTVSIGGGALWELTGLGTSGTPQIGNAVFATGATATGNVEATGPIRLASNTDTGTGQYQGWQNSGGAAMNFFVRFVRGISGSTPSTAGNYGDMYYIGTPAVGVPNGWTVLTPSTSSAGWIPN